MFLLLFLEVTKFDRILFFGLESCVCRVCICLSYFNSSSICGNYLKCLKQNRREHKIEIEREFQCQTANSFWCFILIFVFILLLLAFSADVLVRQIQVLSI